MDPVLFIDLYGLLTLSVALLFAYQLILEWSAAQAAPDRSHIDRLLRPLLVSGCLYALVCYFGSKSLSENLSHTAALSAQILGPLCFFYYAKLMAQWFGVKLPFKGVLTTIVVFHIAYVFVLGIDVVFLKSQLIPYTLIPPTQADLLSGNIYTSTNSDLVVEFDLGRYLIIALGSFNIFYSLIFLRKAMIDKQHMLAIGVVLNFIVIGNDVLFIATKERYLVPLSFLSYLIEGMIITLTVFRETYRRNLELEGDVIEVGKVAEIGALAGQICHDIRNPLAVVKAALGQLEKARSSLSEADNPAARKEARSLEIAHRGVQRIETIITDYLLLMRSDHAVPAAPLRLNEVLRASFELTKPKFEGAGIRVTRVDCPDEAWVTGHENRLVMVFVNLLSNAIDAVAEQPNPWIEVKVARSSHSQAEWEIRVIDSGKGIPADVALKLFLKKVTTKEKGKGTGLGLQFVARVITNYGGRIRVDAHATNTTFVIELPQAEPLEPEASQRQSA